MSLTTTSATPVMLENRGSGNKGMKDCPDKVLRIHTTNSGDVSFYSKSTSEVG
jgi:hypothetical protein